MTKRIISEAAHGDVPVFWDDRGPRDGYFYSCDDVREHCLDAGIEPPERVVAATEKHFRIDAGSAIDAALEYGEHHEDAGSEITQAMVNKLQALLDDWCAETGIVSHVPDYKTEVELDPAAWTAPRAARGEGDALEPAEREAVERTRRIREKYGAGE